MTDPLRDVLARVAAGELAPAAAARLLAGRPADVSPAPEPPPTGVTVAATGVRLTVTGDPTVATVVVDGPHRIHRDGDRLRLEVPGRARPGDGFEVNPRWRWGGLRVDWPYGTGERVAVRVNPALALRLELAACDTQVRATRAAVEFGCFSGSVVLTDHDGPLRGTVTTGSARIEAVLRGDGDELSCDMSALKLTLLRGSDTVVTAHAEMGSVKVAGGGARSVPDDITHLRTTSTAVAGAGHGRLAVAVRMGSAKVTLP